MLTNASAIPTRGIPGWVIRVRAPFMTATIIPVLLGGVAAWVATGTFSWLHFLLSLVGALLLHAGANMLNDYFDHLSGTDIRNRQAIAPFTGGSPILKLGLLEPERVRNEAMAYFAIAALIGCYLTWQSSFWLLAIGAAGLFAGYLYTAYLAPIGWGELFLFLSFGPLMVLGTWVVQTGAPSWEPIWASLPVAYLIMNVLWINQFPDAPADNEAGKRHWVVRLGRERALPIYGLLFVAAYLSLVVNVLTSLAPPWTLAGLLTIPLAWRAWQVARTYYDEMPALRPANELTIQVHLVTGVLLIVGYLIQGIVR
ncbi:MAG: 1,4-dihydroxy-2-naphthoate octaprenyltransferase [Anaerolineae bacterium]|nr:1,4-dihydroxy-2-naphthoate octaprenyltransferase [Anaerolineae bacterium]